MGEESISYVEPVTTYWGEVPLFSEHTKMEAINFIETCGRVCYASEDKIIEGSDIKFVNAILRRKHYSVMEMSNFVIRTKYKLKNPDKELKSMMKSFGFPKYLTFTLEADYVYISGSLRSWIEVLGIRCTDVTGLCGDLFASIESVMRRKNGYIPFRVMTRNQDVPLRSRRITFHFFNDRAFTHELVRHRPCSFLQSSQRYIRYKGEILIIRPHWFGKKDKEMTGKEIAFRWATEKTVKVYRQLLKDGMKAEYARGVLTNAFSTNIVVMAEYDEWLHILSLRDHKAAHPDMQRAMKFVGPTIKSME